MTSGHRGSVGTIVASALVALLALSSSARAQEEESRPEPVPSGKLEGTTLELEDMNAAVDAPGADWKWTSIPGRSAKLQQYLCTSADESTVFLFGVLDERMRSFDQSSAEEFVTGFLGSNQGRSLGLKETGCEPADVPLPKGSFRYEAVGKAESKPVNLHGYFVWAGKLYHFQWYARPDATAAETETYRKFVRSFRLLKEPAPSTPPAGAIFLVLGCWALVIGGLALLGVFVGLVGKRNAPSVAALLIGLLVIGAAFAVPVIFLPHGPQSFEEGQVFGRAMAPACCLGFFPFVGLAIGLRVLVKKKAAP